jgi:hypothetical protein
VTAIGLVVAIPSVLAFNFLSARSDALLLALDQSKGEFLDYLENHGESSSGGRGPAKHSASSASANTLLVEHPEALSGAQA